MDINKHFQEKDIPYDQFARLGYDKKTILFMNKEDIMQLLAGKRTSMMEIDTIDGQKLGQSLKAKFSLQRDEYGKVNLVIHPYRNVIQNDIKLNNTQIERLKQGLLVTKKIDGENYLVQLDKDNNELLKTPIKDIIIPSHIEHIELGQEQKQKLKKGEPIILQADGKDFQVSIDLNARMGFRFDQLQNLELEQKIKFDMEHPEYMGTLQTDENRSQYMEYQRQQQVHNTSEQKEERTNKLTF